MALKYASQKLRNNKNIVLTAVKQNGNALQYVYIELWYDVEVAFNAVSSCGLALKYASQKFKNNRRIVQKAVEENPNAIMYASKDLQLDKQFL